MDYVTIRDTRQVNDNGNDMGPVKKDTLLINSWTKTIKGIPYARFAANRWIPFSDCAEPEEPPVVPPEPAMFMIRFRDEATKVWGPYRLFRETTQ
jgi:hypothetical protein